MEEMNKELMTNTVTEIVEEATDKLTFKENVIAYGLAGVFVVGVATTGYFAYKGAKAVVNKIKDKKKIKEQSEEEEVIDINEGYIHEVGDDETEE